MYKKLKEQISLNKAKFIKLSEQSEYEKETSSLTKILEEIDKTVRGGLSDTHTVESIAKRHGVSVKDIEKEIEIGKKIEMEHTNSKEESVRIAMDHLVEFPDYYTRLVKMEKEAEAELKEYYKLYEEILAEEQLPDNPEYGLPDDKAYPLYDKVHVLAAIKLFAHVSPLKEKKLAKAIIRKMRYYGMRKSNVGEGNRLKKYIDESNLPD